MQNSHEVFSKVLPVSSHEFDGMSFTHFSDTRDVHIGVRKYTVRRSATIGSSKDAATGVFSLTIMRRNASPTKERVITLRTPILNDMLFGLSMSDGLAAFVSANMFTTGDKSYHLNVVDPDLLYTHGDDMISALDSYASEVLDYLGHQQQPRVPSSVVRATFERINERQTA